MNKYLNKFDTTAEYEDAKDNLLKPNTSYLDDSKETAYVRKTDYVKKFNPRYLYSDLSTSIELIAAKASNVIGVEVVPASAAPDHKARFVSVKNMSRSNPEAGSVDVGNSDSNPAARIPWGKTNDVVPGLPQIQNSPYTLRRDGAVTDENPYGFEKQLSSSRGYYLISDYSQLEQYSLMVPLTDKYPFTKGYYLPGYLDRQESEFYLQEGTIDYVMNPDFTLNERYYQTSDVWSHDFDGKSNTSIMVERIKDIVPNWNTGELKTDVSSINHPAAVACYRYNAGGQAGKWYLPAAGELGFLYANICKINKKILALPDGVGVPMGLGCYSEGDFSYGVLGRWLWGSSQSSSYDAWSLYTYDGYMRRYNKGNAYDYCRVRAFFQL